MQLCLMIEGQDGVTWSQWLDIARTCEEAGITTLFTSDHYMGFDGAAGAGGLDSWGVICGLGAVTSRLRLGTLVSPATFRHPAVLAKLVATADHITNGRVELGMGAGWHEPEHQAFGFTFPTLGRRMDTLAEQLEIVLGCWRDGPFSFDGREYTVGPLDVWPKPVQRPHPRLILGGAAAPRGAALAASFADEYNTGAATIDELAERKARIDRACEARGRDPIPFSVAVTLIVAADQDGLRRRIARVAAATGISVGQVLDEPDTIAGTVEQVAQRLGELRDLGVARVMCRHLLPDDLDAIRLLGEQLAPRLD